MAKSKIIYFLIALLFSAQLDDAWVSGPVSASSAVAGDNDEYLPSERRQHSEQSAPHHTPAHVGLDRLAIDFFASGRGPATGSKLLLTFGRCSLYVFMSLLC
jgi:hypothetical protein